MLHEQKDSLAEGLLIARAAMQSLGSRPGFPGLCWGERYLYIFAGDIVRNCGRFELVVGGCKLYFRWVFRFGVDLLIFCVLNFHCK